jgi:hemin uptake protein HemP
MGDRGLSRIEPNDSRNDGERDEADDETPAPRKERRQASAALFADNVDNKVGIGRHVK